MKDTTKASRRRRIGLLCLAVVVLAASHCARHEPKGESEVVVQRVASLPQGLDDPAWNDAPFHDAALILQDLVEPRLLEPSTPSVRVRALTDGSQVAFHLRWTDTTPNDLPGASRFSDACAVQLPVADTPDVPAPQMGETGKRVEIAYWRASWQSAVDGRADEIAALYPNASVDHYPFEAPSLEPGSPEQQGLEQQYAPARALGQAMEGPRERPLEDLIAEGPGTLTPAAQQRSTGTGRRSGDDWEVLIVRPLPAGAGGNGRSQIAFAVWDGERDEVGARKMRSVWIPLHVREGETR